MFLIFYFFCKFCGFFFYFVMKCMYNLYYVYVIKICFYLLLVVENVWVKYIVNKDKINLKFIILCKFFKNIV